MLNKLRSKRRTDGRKPGHRSARRLRHENLEGRVVLTAIHGVVFDDLKHHGEFNPKFDPGVAGVEVTLTPVMGGPVQLAGQGTAPGSITTTTNANGSFLFENLTDGSYVVRHNLRAGYTATTPITQWVVVGNNTSPTITQAASNSVSEVFFGIASAGNIVAVQKQGVDLMLLGNSSNNHVEIHQTKNPGEFYIEGKEGTLLKVNGSLIHGSTVNGIIGDVGVMLGHGDDWFEFSGADSGGQSYVKGGLTIENDWGSNTNVIDEVKVMADLVVEKVPGVWGYTQLKILNSTVEGNTSIQNGIRLIAADFGDAPLPYPTLVSDGGAQHLLDPAGPYLGTTPPDSELNGQPDPSALGDDRAGIDDEDAGGAVAVLRPGETVTSELTVTGTGFASVWIDFNRNGDWNDAGEQVLTDSQFTAPAGVSVNKVFTVTTPGSAVPGPSFMRMRVSSMAGLSSTGVAVDGEVEDHAVTIGGGATLVAAVAGGSWNGGGWDGGGYRSYDPTSGGDSKTLIENSQLKGRQQDRAQPAPVPVPEPASAFALETSIGSQPILALGALTILNGEGFDVVDIRDTKVGVNTMGDTFIHNGDGGSRTTFTSENGLGNVFYGGLGVINGTNPLGVQVYDTVIINKTEVMKTTLIHNMDGDSMVAVQDGSVLGASNTLDTMPPGGGGTITAGQGISMAGISTAGPAVSRFSPVGKLIVLNDHGVDEFMMKDSAAPYGLVIDNAISMLRSSPATAGDSGAEALGLNPGWTTVPSDTMHMYGGRADIINSKIGTNAKSDGGFYFWGDDKDDVVNVFDSWIGGRNGVNIYSYDGDDDIWLFMKGHHVSMVSIDTAQGMDQVRLEDVFATNGTMIDLGESGLDSLELLKATRLQGSADLDGGVGSMDRFVKDVDVVIERLTLDGFEDLDFGP